MTKQEIMAAIKECARNLGHTPNVSELTRITGIRRRAIQRHFGTYIWALHECHLERRGPGGKVGLEDLLRDWARITRKLKKIPGVMEYRHFGKHSETPLRIRYRSWKQVPQSFKKYAEKHGWTKEWRDVLETIAAQEEKKSRAQASAESAEEPRQLPDKPVYGTVMHASLMAHGPTNEMGVVYLFGALSARLGFVVMRIQPEFPDCEAMRQVGKNRWHWVRIEFEYESRNFLKHKHPVKGCDLIVCWIHNWPECPLEVVELSKIFSTHLATKSTGVSCEIAGTANRNLYHKGHEGTQRKAEENLTTDETNKRQTKQRPSSVRGKKYWGLS
ncbi:MAG TPA: hypothetical protein VFF39_10215 [Verrucomicrobiae bacterium]|nr:hypothetical protein [Verrucomicrobiae bacterium]